MISKVFSLDLWLPTYSGLHCNICWKIASFHLFFPAALQVGNILPLSEMPEGTVISAVESQPGDRGKLAKASGNYATVVSHNPDTGKSRIKLPSGIKKVVHSKNRAIIGKKYSQVLFYCRCLNGINMPASYALNALLASFI